MRYIHVQKTFVRPEDLAVPLIRFHCLRIRIDSFLPLAGANVDVRRHMHVVGKSRL
jgi:hypothetical protein